jgi:type II secretory pathway component PulC
MSYAEDQYLALVAKNNYKSHFKTNSFDPKHCIKKAFLLYITIPTLIHVVWELQLMKLCLTDNLTPTANPGKRTGSEADLSLSWYVKGSVIFTFVSCRYGNWAVAIQGQFLNDEVCTGIW